MTVNVCFPFVGDSVGGSHISSIMLIESLAGTPYVPHIVLHEEGALAEHLRGRGLSYEHLPLPRYAGAQPRLADIARASIACCPRLTAYLRRRRIGIVHANDLRMNLTWPLASRVAGAKFVWHQRTMPFSSSRLWRLVPVLATRTLAISKAVSTAMRLPGSSIVYNPFEVTATSPDRAACRSSLLELLGLPQDAVLLGCVGRIVKTKRPDVCVGILAEVARRTAAPVHLLFIGRDSAGLERDLREQAAALGVAERVHFLGFRFPVENDLAGLDALLAPSEVEGFGRAIVEAQLAGTAVVASDIEAHKEIIGSGNGLGAIARSGDVAAFADATCRLLQAASDESRSAARAEIALRFGGDTHRRAITRIYGEISGHPSRYAHG